jgi:hypothetical protein
MLRNLVRSPDLSATILASTQLIGHFFERSEGSNSSSHAWNSASLPSTHDTRSPYRKVAGPASFSVKTTPARLSRASAASVPHQCSASCASVHLLLALFAICAFEGRDRLGDDFLARYSFTAGLRGDTPCRPRSCQGTTSGRSRLFWSTN